MLDYPAIIAAGEAAGFQHVGPLKASTIELRQEVRDMCAANTCGKYDKNWSCPPGCGSLEDLRQQVAGYTEGILVQSVGELEDEMDGEAMMETERRHKANFYRFLDELLPRYPGLLALGSGCCTQCGTCTYPDAPCRFPQRRVSSMESYGMLVLQVCKDNAMQYYYGPCTISYTSCFLLQ